MNSKEHEALKVLIVGQTPPPWGGQAVMVEQLLKCEFVDVDLHHVRMAFSDDMDAIGRFRLNKVLHLIGLIVRICFSRIRYGTRTIYYPPAGPNKVPFYRDVVVLILTRWLFRKTVFHFHASGISSLYSNLNAVEKWMFRRAYFKPDVAIRTSALNPDDGAFLHAKSSIVIENGLPIVYEQYQNLIKQRDEHKVPRILFVGALYETKGVGVLIEACRRIRACNQIFELECIGRFESEEYENHIKRNVDKEGLADCVTFSGVQIGNDKWKAYARADIFCFPSYFESESFGLVNIEAMQFALPVVSTKWRGIPSAVQDGVTGLLVEPKNAEQTAHALLQLLRDKEMRVCMGQAGQQLFLKRFSEAIWSSKMEEALKGEL